VKHISMIAAMFMVMGTVLFPGCDEEKGNDATDLLMMQYVANSKYYLRFDVDYNNDAVVDEHVEMRVTRHFYNLPGYRYQAEFAGKNGYAWIDLPNETTDPITYIGGAINFSFTYDNINDYYYNDESGHDFEFNITEWDTIQRTIRVQFNGNLVYDHEWIDEKIISISNGELYARVVKYYGE
jgi:hypothetical protein